MPKVFSTSPNDSPGDGTIHDIALEQLIIYQTLARNWQTYKSKADGRLSQRCKTCGQSLWFWTDKQGHPYTYTPQMKESLVVAHIRQIHPRQEDYATD